MTGFPAEYDGLWQTARAGYAMCVRRDAAYLRWKYLDCPHVRYDQLEARREGALCGFAVSRVAEHQGLKLGWILDLYSAADDDAARDALLQAQLDAFLRAGVARVQAFAMHAEGWEFMQAWTSHSSGDWLFFRRPRNNEAIDIRTLRIAEFLAGVGCFNPCRHALRVEATKRLMNMQLERSVTTSLDYANLSEYVSFGTADFNRIVDRLTAKNK